MRYLIRSMIVAMLLSTTLSANAQISNISATTLIYNFEYGSLQERREAKRLIQAVTFAYYSMNNKYKGEYNVGEFFCLPVGEVLFEDVLSHLKQYLAVPKNAPLRGVSFEGPLFFALQGAYPCPASAR